MEQLLNHCLAYLNGEKTAFKRESFSYLFKTASKSELAKKTLELGKKALPSFIGTGAALTGGAMAANHVANKKVEEYKEKAKKVATGALATIGTAAALYSAHKHAQNKSREGFSNGYKRGMSQGYSAGALEHMPKFASREELEDLTTCFFLDDLLKTASSTSEEARGLLKLNDEMIDHLAYGMLDKCAKEESKKKEDKETKEEEVPAEEVPTEEVPTEEVPTEEVPTEEVPTEEVPAEGVPAEEVPAEQVHTEQAPAEQLTEEEQMAPTPVGTVGVDQYATERIMGGSAETDTQLAITQEQQALDQLNKHIQVSANNGQAPNPSIQAAALDRQSKINTLQNYMNSLASMKTAVPPVDPLSLPMEQAPMEQAPMEQAPMEQAPMEQAPMEQAPMEQAPMEQAPTEQPQEVAPIK